MEDCIFCKIVEGQIPCYKVFEDEEVLAFLDVTPATKGHTLIIPKAHFKNIFDIPKDLLGRISIVAQKLAQEFENKLKADGFNLVQSSKKHAQQEVNHFHMHLLPRYARDKMDLWKTKKEHPIEDDLEKTHKILS